MQAIAGVQAVKATRFAPLGTTGPAVVDTIALGRTNVARLDADPDFPEHGTLAVLAIGLDVDAGPLVRDTGQGVPA